VLTVEKAASDITIYCHWQIFMAQVPGILNVHDPYPISVPAAIAQKLPSTHCVDAIRSQISLERLKIWRFSCRAGKHRNRLNINSFEYISISAQSFD